MATLTFRDLVNIGAYRATLLALKMRLLLQRKLGRDADYQPDPFAPHPPPATSETRQSVDRFKAFSALLPPGEPLSAMDIGCNDGFFVFKLAERGGLCMGIDQDRNAVMVAQARAALHRRNNAVFANLTVTNAFAKTLPQVDVVVCLSIFHHWARHLGADAGIALLREIAGKAGRYFIFETGQPNEAGAQWAQDLAFMGNDPEAWIREALLGFGFDRVDAVGTFATTVTATPRTLFVAQRKG